MPMSSWTHALCDFCWYDLEEGRVPVRLTDEMREEEVCCRCGETTDSGIYRRAEPGTFERCDHDRESLGSGP